MTTFNFPDTNSWLTNQKYVFNAPARDPLPIEHGTYLRLYGEDYVTNQQGTTIIFNGHEEDRDQWDGIKSYSFSLTTSQHKDKFILKNGGFWVHWDNKVALLGGNDLIKINYTNKNFTDIKNHVGLEVHGDLDLGGDDDTINAKAMYRGLEIGHHGELKTGLGNDKVIAKSKDTYGLDISGVLDTGKGDDLIIGRKKSKDDESGGIFINYDAKLFTGEGNDVIKGNGLYARPRSQIDTGSGEDFIESPLRSGSANLKQRPLINMGGGQDYLRMDAGDYAIKPLSNGNYLIKTLRGESELYAELEDVEFIAGPKGDWLELKEGTFSL